MKAVCAAPMTVPREEFPFILAAILDVGEMMLTSGAEVNRVEDTMQRMARAYGCTRVDVFTITSSIVVTAHCADGEIFTQTRRILNYDTDMYKIERCNSLSRQVCAKPLSRADLEAAIHGIRKERAYPKWLNCFGYCLVAFSFTLFFGGSIWDALASCICGFLLYLATTLCVWIRLQRFVMTILCSAVVGLGAVALTQLGLGASIDKICIGNVMLLIPGISFTTSLRDMISGDTISGLLGLCEALLRAVAIAIGFAVILWQFGG